MGASQTPWQAACELHAALRAGHVLPEVPVSPAITRPCDPGEYQVGVFGWPVGLAVDYARFTSQDVVVVNGGPAMVVGTPHFLAGYALGSIVNRHRTRKRAKHMAQPQWHPRPMAHAVVTTRRLWCEISGDEWKYFNYNTAVDLRLDDRHALEMWFGTHVPAVRLGGPWAPWIAIAIAHLMYGTAAEDRLPWLSRFRIPSRTPL
jgi:hypothetical protein